VVEVVWNVGSLLWILCAPLDKFSTFGRNSVRRVWRELNRGDRSSAVKEQGFSLVPSPTENSGHSGLEIPEARARAEKQADERHEARGKQQIVYLSK
jgi:hypothetical protein